jgi:PmbA protein
VSEPDKGALFDAVKDLIGSVTSDYPKIIVEQLFADHRRSNTLYLNSNGAQYTYDRGCYEFSSTFSAHEGEKASSFSGYGARFLGFGTRLIDFPMHRDLLRESEESLKAKSAGNKQTGTLILTPNCLHEIFGTIFSNFISDSVIIDKTSPWKDMLGKPVADERITVSASPLDPRIVCGSRITGDGYRAENCTLKENGNLKTFQLSQYGSRKTGLPRAANYGSEYVVAPGDKALADMIASTKHGVLMGRFSGGQPGTNGDFSGVAKNSFLIENGEIAGALSETMISGNFVEMLKTLIDILKETVCTSYAVLPWMSFGGVTIAGAE